MAFEFPVQAKPALSTDQNPKVISTDRNQKPSGKNLQSFGEE
jgi:hypothetical protein